MKIRIERQVFDDQSTIGELFVDGAFECYVLEDKVRENGSPVAAWKVPRETAIPYGLYDVEITPSKRFGRDMPLLLNVPGFDGVRIHPGNTDADTEGCLLVGRVQGKDCIGESKAAFAALYPKIEAAIDAGDKVTIEIARAT